MTSTSKQIGRRLHQAREIQGVSISSLSVLTGTEARLILGWEKGISPISERDLRTIARNLHTKLAWLKTGVGYPFLKNKAIRIIPERGVSLLRKIVKDASNICAVLTDDTKGGVRYALVFESDGTIDVLLALVSERSAFENSLKRMNVQTRIIQAVKPQIGVKDNLYGQETRLRDAIHSLRNAAGTLSAFVEGVLSSQEDPRDFVRQHGSVGKKAMSNIIKTLASIRK